MDLQLTGKHALVTGGSAGIGRAIAETLCREGATVTICARRRDVLKSAESELGVRGVRCDVTRATDVARLFKGIRRLDILVNNAGGLDHFTNFRATSLAQWRRTFEWNLYSAVEVTRRALPLLLRSRGAIVNIASEVGRQPFALAPDYCSSKAALLALTKSLANELASEGVRVNAICPGPVLTHSWVRQAGSERSLRALTKRVARERIPMGRIGMPEDIAGLTAFLCSSRASWITGAAYSVDGGSIRSVF